MVDGSEREQERELAIPCLFFFFTYTRTFTLTAAKRPPSLLPLSVLRVLCGEIPSGWVGVGGRGQKNQGIGRSLCFHLSFPHHPPFTIHRGKAAPLITHHLFYSTLILLNLRRVAPHLFFLLSPGEGLRYHWQEGTL